MVTITEVKYAGAQGIQCAGLAGKSTDPKPTDQFGGYEIQNGASFLEVDTAGVALYDAESKSWNEVV